MKSGKEDYSDVGHHLITLCHCKNVAMAYLVCLDMVLSTACNSIVLDNRPDLKSLMAVPKY